MPTYYAIERSASLYHHGVKGMRWGVRRTKAHQLTGVRRKIRTDGKNQQTAEEAKRARRRKIAKRVAIGVGAAAAIAGTAYAVKRAKDIREYGRQLKEADAIDRKIKREHPDVSFGDMPGSTVAKNWDRYTLRTKAKLERDNRKYGGGAAFHYYDHWGVGTKKNDTFSTKVRRRLDAHNAAKQAKASHKANRAKEQAEYIRNMASKTALKNTSHNPGDKPYLDSSVAAAKRFAKQYNADRPKLPASVPKSNKGHRLNISPKAKERAERTLNPVAEELLRKNAKRLRDAGY